MASTKSSSSAQPSADERRTEELCRLEERYRHELLDDEERQELRDKIWQLRR